MSTKDFKEPLDGTIELQLDASDSSVAGTGTTAPSVADSASIISAPAEDILKDEKDEKPKEDVIVQLPDLFAGLLSVRPVVNPHYWQVKVEACNWIVEVLGGDGHLGAKFMGVDICFLVAIWAPTCDAEALRVMTDWNHWVFLFDDQFDEGAFVSDLPGAEREIKRTIDIMNDTEPPVTLADGNPIAYVMQTIWDRVKKRASLVLQARIREMHQRYCDGIIRQVRSMAEGNSLSRDVQQYMDMRRGTIGVYPAISLTEYAMGIECPKECFDHPSLQMCMDISTDLVFLANDITSFKKDLALGVDHNLITLLQAQGMTAQEALDRIGDMWKSYWKPWYTAVAELPSWGEKTDREVLKFIEACLNVALGNLYWSYKTDRYLGTEADEVRRTRMLKLTL